MQELFLWMQEDRRPLGSCQRKTRRTATPYSKIAARSGDRSAPASGKPVAQRHHILKLGLGRSPLGSCQRESRREATPYYFFKIGVARGHDFSAGGSRAVSNSDTLFFKIGVTEGHDLSAGRSQAVSNSDTISSILVDYLLYIPLSSQNPPNFLSFCQNILSAKSYLFF